MRAKLTIWFLFGSHVAKISFIFFRGGATRKARNKKKGKIVNINNYKSKSTAAILNNVE